MRVSESRKNDLTGSATVDSHMPLERQYSLVNQSRRRRFPRLELQLQQQIATVSGLSHGGRWLRCSIVAQSDREPPEPEGTIVLWQ